MLAIDGGCAPLELLPAAQEARCRQLAANGWRIQTRTTKSCEALESLYAAAIERIINDHIWLSNHPDEDPSPYALSSRRVNLARSGVALVALETYHCGQAKITDYAKLYRALAKF